LRWSYSVSSSRVRVPRARTGKERYFRRDIVRLSCLRHRKNLQARLRPGLTRPRILLRRLLSSTTGWRTITPCTRTPDWATDHRAGTFFPNRLRVRFNGVMCGRPPPRKDFFTMLRSARWGADNVSGLFEAARTAAGPDAIRGSGRYQPRGL